MKDFFIIIGQTVLFFLNLAIGITFFAFLAKVIWGAIKWTFNF